MILTQAAVSKHKIATAMVMAMMPVPGRCREIKKTHTFETYPTTHFFAHGTLLLTREGVVEPAELAALISDHLLT